MELLKKLHEPKLVADFQRLCGIIIHDKPRSPQNGDSGCNASGYSNGYINGDAKTEKNIRHRSQISNGCTLNGYTQNDDKQMSNGTYHPLTSRASESAIDDNSSASADSDDSPSVASPKSGPVTYTATIKLFYYMFRIGAFIGDEAFYCILWTVWFWNLDGYIIRRVCYIWCITMYIGQATKDVIRWPRPASPPVARMEDRYELEYGMPSTHAMVGASIPFSALALTMARYEVSLVLGLIICVIWCSVVCFSRLYLGMHSVLDVLAGLLYVGILVPISYPFLDPMDHFIQTHPYAPVFSILIPLIFCLCYPSLEKWSTARGDTTIILGVGTGVALSTWLNYQHGFVVESPTEPPYPIYAPTLEWLGYIVLRMIVGVPVLVLTRTVVKKSSYRFMCYVLGLDHQDINKERHQAQQLKLELPYKFVTYIAIAFSVVYLTPVIFRYLNIQRENFIYEV